MRKFSIRKFMMVTLVSLFFIPSAQAALVILEVLNDGPDTKPVDVLTRLYGTPGIDLSGWSLAGINGGNRQVYRRSNLHGHVIPDDDIFVLTTLSANRVLVSNLFGTDINSNAVNFTAGMRMPGNSPSVVPVPATA